MPEKTSLRKAVYFSQDELPLREWAEGKPEGFSTYIKRLITEDQQGERLRNNVIQVIEGYTDSQAGQATLVHLARELAKALDGKLIKQSDTNGGTSEVAELFSEEIDQIASFMIGQNG